MITQEGAIAGLLVVAMVVIGVALYRTFGRVGSSQPLKVTWSDDLARLPSDSERQHAFEEAARLAHERTKCLRCDEKATVPAPMIVGVPLEDWPFIGGVISFFWDLFSLPWIYSVKPNVMGGDCYCLSHAQETYDDCKNECAQLRALHAKFNTEQQARVTGKNRSFTRKSHK